MPTYTYACAGCSANFEQFQKFSDAPIEVCPSCGDTVRRVIHPVGVVFKGSGWYINDSRPSTATSESTATSKESDPKPAAETPSAPAASAPATPATATPAPAAAD